MSFRNHMSYALKRFTDPGLLLIIILTFVVAEPIWTSDGLSSPAGDEGHHLRRIVIMRNSWLAGEFFPSWAEATYWGYGSPVFHFYASLTYHIASAIQLVFNLGLIQAARWLLLLSFMLAGIGMYLFCRRRSGALGALIGALIYVSSPYFLVMEADVRGAYPALFAQALFPLLLWRVDSLRDAPSGRNLLLVILLEAALINTHNLQAVLYTGVAFAWLAWEGLIQRVNREAGRVDARGDLWAALALLLGILAAASFWLPILLEGHTIKNEGLLKSWSISLWPSVSELLKIPPQFYTWDRPTFTDSYHIGIAQWTYALVGAGGALALYVRGYRSRHPGVFLAALFFFLLSIPLILLMLPWSHPLWHSFVPFRYLQFPIRFLGPIVLCCGYLASLNGLWLRRLPGHVGPLAIALAVAAVVVAGFAMSRTMSWDRQNIDVSMLRLMTTSKPAASAGRDFFPSTASSDVDQTRLLEDYVDGYPIDKFDRDSLPPGAEATLLRNAPEFHAWRVLSPAPFDAVILNYWWPGWAATVDGSAVPVAPSPGLGLIRASLPAGEYTLRVYLGSTPAREAGAWISALALVGGLALAWRLRRLGIKPMPYAKAQPLNASEIHGLMLAGLIIALSYFIIFF